ncbi:MAG TPA: hypothetical protein VEJ23_05600, partial [Solirubrobacteraceae bacterium]|nr:hypothetical protein [Solirubrobacteraceae bacterium]
MATHAAGYELEAGSLERTVLETRARMIEVADDDTDEAGRRWLLQKGKRSITAALQASFPEVDPSDVSKLHGALSQQTHADPRAIIRMLAIVDDDHGAELNWGPGRTI